MGQEFGKCVKTDSVDDLSGVYKKCTPAQSTANGIHDGGRKKHRFWRRKKDKGQVQATEVIDVASDRNEFQENQETLTCDLKILSTQDPVLSETHVQVHFGSELTEDTVRDPVLSETHVQVHFGSELTEDTVRDPVLSETHVHVHFGSELTEDTVRDPVLSETHVQVHFGSELTEDTFRDPVLSETHVQVHFGSELTEDAVRDPVAIESDWEEELVWNMEIQPASVSLDEEEMDEDEEPSVVIQEINSWQYEIGDILAECAFGAIYEGTRVKDGLKVAVKRVNTLKHLDYISIPGHPEPLPREVALHILACKGEVFPEVVQLLDWQVYPDHYIMVLERPSPCVDVRDFATSNGGQLGEELAKDIMWQATRAAYKCCQRGVFHRDIKMENLLITTDTLYVKLIDFRCGDVLTRSPYKMFMGTRDYVCPEFFKTGAYYGQPATVYSLGALLFAMVCGTFPNRIHQDSIDKRTLYKNLTEECCDLIEACLQEDPDDRIDLDEILDHKWFQDKYPAYCLQTPVHFNEDKEDDQKPKINCQQYEIGSELGQGGFGTVFDGTRLRDGLKVAVKIVKKTKDVIDDLINIPGHPEPLPREVGLQMLACDGVHVPVIVQFLDWQDYPDEYMMVLERPTPCMDIRSFVKDMGGSVTENIAKAIMGQATYAAEVCCLRGVFHRDLKQENLLINPDTLEVKLIDFGCGDLLKRSPYHEYMGTMIYACPEYFEWGQYYGKPATVYSLGVLLFAVVCGRYPTHFDLDQIEKKSWSEAGLTEECCDLIEACLQKDPDDRIDLDEITDHRWFQDKYPAYCLQTPVHFNEDKEDDQKPKINCQQYEIGSELGQGGFGTVFDGTRLRDGLKVAVKIVKKTKDVIDDLINIPGHPEPLPREVGLQMLACDGVHVPVIVQFLDWQDYPDEYMMVLERPTPCMDIRSFVKDMGGSVTENVAKAIMGQATYAAEVCCLRGVFHRDLKQENLLINPDTLEVKLIDFGCGDLLKRSPYHEYMGTMIYACPEYFEWGQYYGKPATVYSLGVLLFAVVCGRYPTHFDLDQVEKKSWSEAGLTEECCDLIEACLQKDPDDRIDLDEITDHRWFQEDSANGLRSPLHTGRDDVFEDSDNAGSEFNDDGEVIIQQTSVGSASGVVPTTPYFCGYKVANRVGNIPNLVGNLRDSVNPGVSPSSVRTTANGIFAQVHTETSGRNTIRVPPQTEQPRHDLDIRSGESKD
ncbi:Serine/threonine-protein kinase pim-2 [Triplophysa tibetana]|uniref:non-specific serine/threonine protein kinase n=1 Tax=Triplophysa tibetana TaxID=1572043 RepID=A0A5A9P216_9TELE|nr:Serine/threonine-protein kinase pim-2 [Triplophysa tibetana]